MQLLKRRLEVDDKDPVLAPSAVVAPLLFKNSQRPGAAANLTVDEYTQATEVQLGAKVLTVLRVRDRKTGVKGSVKLTIEQGDARRLQRYYRWVLPASPIVNLKSEQ